MSKLENLALCVSAWELKTGGYTIVDGVHTFQIPPIVELRMEDFLCIVDND